MLNIKLLHPQILAAVAGAGHGAKLLIADGNYPASTARGERAEVVYLNLCPGVVRCTDVLQTLLGVVPVEAVHAMAPESGSRFLQGEPEIWTPYREILAASAPGLELEAIERFAFYAAASGDDHILTISTGDTRLYANLLLTVGVRSEGE